MVAGIRSVGRRSKPISNHQLAGVVGLFSATITTAARLIATGVESPSIGRNLEGSTQVLPFLCLTVNIGERTLGNSAAEWALLLGPRSRGHSTTVIRVGDKLLRVKNSSPTFERVSEELLGEEPMLVEHVRSS